MVVARHVIGRLIAMSAVVVVAGAYLISAAPAIATPRPGWSLVPTPNQQGSGGQLSAVSCATANSCVAVGSVDVGFRVVTAAESWNGHSWSLHYMAVPAHGLNARLIAVSCSSARACMAVGSYQTSQARLRSENLDTRLAELWNGKTWSVVLKSGGGELDSVSCPSATSCLAVGYTNANAAFTVASPVAERWNGHGWAVQQLPHFGGPRLQALNAVTCASASECMAVGQGGSFTDGRPIAARWNGRRWIGIAMPNLHTSQTFVVPASLSCGSPHSCMAIGWTTPYSTSTMPTPSSPLAWRWNGRKWAFVKVPATVAFDNAAISCPAVNRCLAVSWTIYYGQAVGLQQLSVWNGRSWNLTSSTTNSQQIAISCTSRSQCTTVGTTAGGRTLAERWNGTQVSVQNTVDPHVERFSQQLTSLSCLRSADCVAINSYGVLYGGSSSSAERWNGAGWLLQRIATLASPDQTFLNDVSCPTAGSQCIAVGQSVAGFAGETQKALAESWNGTSFSLLPAPPSANDLLGVSCVSASACVAVGVNNVPAGPVIDSWNGSGWTSQPAAAGAFELTAISCATATDCMALGINAANGAIAQFFNGTSWTPEPLPAKANPIAIDCPTVTRCIAVGTGTIDYWNGTSWSGQPGVSSKEQLDAVSCLTASSCMAVGDEAARALAEYWNGSHWVAERPPMPKGSTRSSLTSVTCGSTGCMAVGGYTAKTLRGNWQTLADRYARA